MSGPVEAQFWGMVLEKPFLCPGQSTDLRLDEACLTISNRINRSISLWIQSEECYQCPLWRYVTVGPGSTAHQVVNTTYTSRLSIQDGTAALSLCRAERHFGEFGWYQMNVEGLNNRSLTCAIDTQYSPADIYAPLLFVGACLALLAVVVRVLHVLYDKMYLHRMIRLLGGASLLTNDLGDPDVSVAMVETGGGVDLSPVTRQLQRRVRSLDVFRGLAIVLMMFVNYGGGGYPMFRHAPWNGLTIADVVFPWFLWICGVSLFLSLRAQIRRSVPKSQVCVVMARRCAILFVLGLSVNSVSVSQSNRAHTAHLQQLQPTVMLRLPGVLQRIAVCTAMISAVLLPSLQPEEAQLIGRLSPVRDIVCVWGQWLVVLALTVVHTLITFLFPVPQCPTGYLGAGGLYGGGHEVNCTGGAAGYIDRALFGRLMYQRPTCRTVYDTRQPYDPEGVLGTLTSCLVVFLGCAAGRIFVVYTEWKPRVLRFIVWSIVLCVVGGALCSFSVNDGFIPINKNLWSLSYVLVTAGLAFGVHCAIYVAVDVFRLWSGRPFYYAGLNSIVLYVGHVICARVFPVSLASVTVDLIDTHLTRLALVVWSLLVWLFFAWRLYKRRMFVTI